jgi:hypothetical protein
MAVAHRSCQTQPLIEALLAAGTYCVSINPSEEPNLSLLRPGIWTSPEVSESTIDITVTLAEGENAFDINFGWDHQFLP